jgi:cupin fold WbuC family metalloprotein
MYIVSKKNTKKIIGCIFFYKKNKKDRIDFSSKNEFIQTALICKNKSFILKPHKHLNIKRKTSITQEVWIVIEGIIEVTFFDIDKKILTKKILKKNDMAILFRGGHSMRVLSKKMRIYEIKNGPYLGKIKDKENI